MRAESVQQEQDGPALGCCVIVGGGGWLGQRLARDLAEVPAAGVTRIVTVDVSVPRQPVGEGVEHRIVDILDGHAVESAFKELKPQTVFCLAAIIDVRLSGSPLTWSVNRDGPANVLRACKEAGVQQLLHCSTLDVKCGSNGMHYVKEDAPYCTPGAFDGKYIPSKIAGEQVVFAGVSSEPGALKIAILRLANVFGPGDNVLPAVSIPVGIGRASVKMSHVYVDNAAAAFRIAACQFARGGEKAEELNGKAVNIADFMENHFVLYRAMYDGCSLAEAQKSIWIWFPYWFMIRVAMIVDILEYLIFAVTGRHLLQPHPKVGISSAAMRDCSLELTMNCERAEKLLEYVPPIGKEECMRRCHAWLVQERARQNMKRGPTMEDMKAASGKSA